VVIFISKSLFPTFIKKIINIVFYRGYSIYLDTYSFSKRVSFVGENILIKGTIGNNGIHKFASAYLIFKIINPYHPNISIFNSDNDLPFKSKQANRTVDIRRGSKLEFAFSWTIPADIKPQLLYLKIEVWSPRKLYGEKSIFYFPYQFDSSGWRSFVEIIAKPNSLIMCPKIFISYAWVNESHKNWVQDLADELIKINLEVIFDRELLPGQEITKFMERSVNEADIILLICSKIFTRKANNREGGAGYETILNTKKYLNSSFKEQFIPIIRDNDLKPSDKIPDFLGSTLYV